jgi:hypothetical protein
MKRDMKCGLLEWCHVVPMFWMVCYVHLRGRRDACEMQLPLQSWWLIWHVSMLRQHLTTKLHSMVSQTTALVVWFAVRDKNLAKVRHTAEEWVFLYHILLRSSLPHKHSPIHVLTLSLKFSVIYSCLPNVHVLYTFIFLSPHTVYMRTSCVI